MGTWEDGQKTTGFVDASFRECMPPFLQFVCIMSVQFVHSLCAACVRKLSVGVATNHLHPQHPTRQSCEEGHNQLPVSERDRSMPPPRLHALFVAPF